ncbi:chromosome partitioning protein, ParB family [Sporobacter termitidis DSM 10068]|uniref:Chromosome partitioning protein, ParB family n=1 Tax=Sporobacter termitidis DSM 10068 TaxID=1123282 RepID=A0A1M5VUV0_9FIRM|nr:ParB/RepB/Spo0J family partition protein [Sporobacter termitidis]SHH78978.1 chromosome partitioning protein, ParB family [Sporobacter termitidis DSM 10068]
MAEKGLGTGLGALFGDAVFDAIPNDFVYLPIAKVEPRSDQPRNIFDEEGLGELAESIREHGVLQPLTVRSIGSGYYQIIAGERRWRASRLAGLSEVPARIIDADDKKATELAMVENLQRENLNPVEEATGYKKLMSDYGMTQEEVARRVSKSRPVVANALRLLSLPPNLLKKLESGELSVGSARTLLSLDSEAQMQAAALKIAENNMTVRDAEKLVKTIKKEKPERDQAGNDGVIVNYVEELENRLTKTLGRRVKIVEGKHKGRFEIEYYDREDFERLFELLSSLQA